MEGKFRHELKYSIGYADYLSLRAKLRTVMQPDGHVDAEGKYLIRSVYFDNYGIKRSGKKSRGLRCGKNSASATITIIFPLLRWKRRLKITTSA